MSLGDIVVVMQEQCARSGIWDAPTSPLGIRVSDREVFLQSALYGGLWLAIPIDMLKLGTDSNERRAAAIRCSRPGHGVVDGWRPPLELREAGMPCALMVDRWIGVEDAEVQRTLLPADPG